MNMIAAGAISTQCDALKFFQSGRPAQVSFLPETSMGDMRIYSPILLGAMTDEQGEDRKELARNGRSFGDLESDPHRQLLIRKGPIPARSADEDDNGDLIINSQSPYEINYTYDGFFNSLSVIARGDFTGEGVEDFLVSFHYAPIEGSFQSTSAVILTRHPGRRVIEPVTDADLTRVSVFAHMSRAGCKIQWLTAARKSAGLTIGMAPTRPRTSKSLSPLTR